MPAVHIRNVREETLLALKERALRNGRSLEAELRHVLDQTANFGGSKAAGSILDRITTVRTGRARPFSRDDLYHDTDTDGR